MKLSEAMMLGAALVKMEPGNWNTCALGAAANAVGIAKTDLPKGAGRFDLIVVYWPWLGVRGPLGDYVASLIWHRFDNAVCKGLMSFEALVDYVRSIEPECGECNWHMCTCAKCTCQKKAVQELAAEVHVG